MFKELLSRIGQEKNGVPHIPKIAEKKNNRYSIPDIPGDVEQMFPREKGNKKMKANTVSGGRNRIKKILDKTRFSILPPKLFRYEKTKAQLYHRLRSSFCLVFSNKKNLLIWSVNSFLCPFACPVFPSV